MGVALAVRIYGLPDDDEPDVRVQVSNLPGGRAILERVTNLTQIVQQVVDAAGFIVTVVGPSTTLDQLDLQVREPLACRPGPVQARESTGETQARLRGVLAVLEMDEPVTRAYVDGRT